MAEAVLVAEVYLALLTVYVGDAHRLILGWRRPVFVKCARGSDPGEEESGVKGEQPVNQGAMNSWLRELLEAVLPALVIVLVVNVFLAQATRVEGQSMDPALHDRQRIVIEKLTYRFRPPRRGEIVVLRRRQPDPLIKRVVGLPGEMVAIENGRVYIDGQPLDEPYLNEMTRGVLSPQIVPEGHVFVLGDNRDSSNDSRAFGMVSVEDIVGRAWMRYWPPKEIGLVSFD